MVAVYARRPARKSLQDTWLLDLDEKLMKEKKKT
jgi:hypothetical protein